tara:strand:- start:60141 stop:60575 length:435 start_codon:yes stop_codon:yes gene_type:complete
MPISSSIKKALHQCCLTLAEDRIASLQHILKETQQAANNETKSSAGDKHETGRAMAQLETEKLTSQLTEALNIKQNLAQINPTITSKVVVLGSAVYTNKGNFYIAASIGKVAIENEVFFCYFSCLSYRQVIAHQKRKRKLLIKW